MLLLSFRYAPADEIEQVRALLVDNQIDFYEVPPSFMGFNPGGIWLRNKAQQKEASALLHQYQQHRAEQARQDWNLQKQQGTHLTQWQMIKAHPFRFILTCIGITLLLGLMTIPFWFF